MKQFYNTLAILLFSITIFAQSTNNIQYQVILKDNSNSLVVNQLVNLQISILQNSSTGAVVYLETHSLTTNINGLVTLAIGSGTTTDDFSSIDWSTGTNFIKYEADPSGGNNFTITGTTQMMSLPYALSAKSIYEPTYNINTFYPELGGYVIKISDNGKHGLVVALTDQGTSSWYEVNDLLSDTSNFDIYAKKYYDWRLPTNNELILAENYISNFGTNSSTDFYWASTEFDDNSAYAYGWTFSPTFNNYSNGPLDKVSSYNVRAVRSF